MDVVFAVMRFSLHPNGGASWPIGAVYTVNGGGLRSLVQVSDRAQDAAGVGLSLTLTAEAFGRTYTQAAAGRRGAAAVQAAADRPTVSVFLSEPDIIRIANDADPEASVRDAVAAMS